MKNSVFHSKVVCFFEIHFAVILQIGFITNKNKIDVFVTILSSFIQPSVNCIDISLKACNIINQKSTYNSSIIRPCNWSIVFLSCRIPYLKSNIFLIQINFFVSKFYSDCWIRVFIKLSINILIQKTWFTHTRISNKNHFKQIIIFIHLLFIDE